jgi:uncharacterized protein YkwD
MVRLALIGVLGAGLVFAVLVQQGHGGPVGFGGNSHSFKGDTKISILPGLPSITLHGDPLYAKDDPWRRYLAPERECPGGEILDAPLRSQAETMVCLVNYARTQDGLQPVSTVGLLNESSLAKARKIVRCTDFNHDACGEDAAADARGAGYNGAWGENLYIAEGRHGSPRVALDGWLNSPEHRENLLTPDWRTQGIAVEKVARFGDDRNVTLWVNQFGT